MELLESVFVNLAKKIKIWSGFRKLLERCSYMALLLNSLFSYASQAIVD